MVYFGITMVCHFVQDCGVVTGFEDGLNVSDQIGIWRDLDVSRGKNTG